MVKPVEMMQQWSATELLTNQNRRKILLDAVDAYLAWRENKGLPDKRGYPVTLMTRLRHFTSFGKKRAQALKAALHSDENPLVIIQRHLQVSSTLYDHSLDTFILEAMLHNWNLFLITIHFKKFNTSALREKLRTFVLNIASNIESTHLLGCSFYQRPEDILWCMQAAELKHPEATFYLANTDFSAESYYLMAQTYEQGNEAIKSNLPEALACYYRAADLFHPEAAFRLGQFYDCLLPQLVDPSTGTPLIIKDDKKAYHFYLIAVKAGHDKARGALLSLARHLNQSHWYFSLALLSVDKLNDYPYALKCLESIDPNQAAKDLQPLALRSARYAYLLANFYQEHEDIGGHLYLAYIYYDLAEQLSTDQAFKDKIGAQKSPLFASLSSQDLNHLGIFYLKGSFGINSNLNQSIIYFEQARLKGDAQAHYNLGKMHRAGLGLPKNRVSAAKYFKLAADKGYEPALSKLDQLMYSNNISPREITEIAFMFYSGQEDLQPDVARAYIYFKLADERQDARAAFYLGQMAQVDYPYRPKDSTLAFQAYLRAALRGCKEALAPLERLGEQMKAPLQRSLADCYGSFFHNPRKAKYWHERADEATLSAKRA